jgi:natural product precursor
MVSFYPLILQRELYKKMFYLKNLVKMQTIKKLKLNKRAVVNLDGNEMKQLKGGYAIDADATGKATCGAATCNLKCGK